MQISYKKWQEEIDKIKADNGYEYLTKKRCRQQYGWDWKVKDYYPYVLIRFHNPSVELLYRLKWS